MSNCSDHTPRIYVACLAAYNSGILHGEWIEADQGKDHIQERVAAMLAASPVADAEEWAIHDFEGFEGLNLSEWTSFEDVSAKAEFIGEHGELGGLVAEHFCGDLDAAREAMTDHYAGAWDSLEDFAESLTEDTGGLQSVPDHLARYIDFAAMGRDLELGGDVFTLNTRDHQLHVFWSR